jgi:DNA-binding beta-propeller fold protein YncE
MAGVLALRQASVDPLVRSVSIAGQPIAVVVDERAGRAFVVDRGTNVDAGTVTVLQTRDGAVLRTLFAGSSPYAAAVDSRTAHLFVTDLASHGVSMLDTRSGVLLAVAPALPNWHSSDPSMSGPQTIVTGVAVDESRARAFVAVGSAYAGVSGGVTVLDATSGRPLGVVEVGQGASSLAVDPSSGHLFVLDNVVARVLLVDVPGGRLLHTAAVGQGPTAMALDARTERLFVASAGASAIGGSTSAGTLSVLDARTGALLRTVITGIAPSAVAVDAQTSRVFVANAGSLDGQGRSRGDGSVSMLDARTGAVLRTLPTVQSPSVLAVDARAGRLFVATRGDASSPGSLLILDARSGALLHAVAVGLYPTAVAVDERAERVFVTDVGGVTGASGTLPWLQGPLWGSLRRWVPFLPEQQPSSRIIPAGVSVLNATF